MLRTKCERVITLIRRKKLPNLINDIPLNFKFLLIYILCVLVPIMTINLIYSAKISNDVKKRETENYNISINRTEKDIYNIIDACANVSYSVSSDKSLYEALEAKYKGDSEYYQTYNDTLRDRITSYIPVHSDISEITVYTSNDTIDNGGNYYYINQSVIDSPWYKNIEKVSNKIILYTYRDKDSNVINYNPLHLSILRQLNEFASSSDPYNHVLKIDININEIYDIFDRERDYFSFLLVDPENRIVCSTDHKYEKDLFEQYTKLDSVKFGKTAQDYLKVDLGNNGYLAGWNIVAMPNRENITKEAYESNIFVAAVSIGVTVLASLLIWIIVRSYNYRVKKLLKHMKKVENQNFELIETSEGKDEIGELILSFNMMTSEINTLINDVYKLEIKKKDLEIQRVQAELRFLQSQIDPHFLFNTLNAVMAICVKNNYEDLTEVIKYLSKIFRRLVSWKDDLVTIGEEISFTEMYLKIEKFRFLEKFHYEIHVDEETLALRIPKMSIQTLVENACKHGIQNISDVGVVKIKVTQDEKFAHIYVEDNGGGIEEDKLKEIMEGLSEEDNLFENIGIRNVYKRLRLYYGDDIEFDIKSAINKGTTIHYGIDKSVINKNKYIE